MSDLQENKKIIESDLANLSTGINEIGKRLRQAKAEGKETDTSLLEKLKLFEAKSEELQVQYSSLQQQEEKPQQEQISKLGQELRTPYAVAPPRGYAPYGLMPDAPNITGGDIYPTVEQDTQRKREIIGQLYNAPVGSKEAEQLPAVVRAGVGALPTPESELEYLKRTYPNANITPIDVGGNTEYLIKNQDGTSFTTLDKGIAGTAGMLAVEAPLAVAEIGATLGTLAATKSPVTATLAGGATRATLGPIADSITRAALSMPQKVVESIGRRGLEAAIGTAAGLGIDVAPSTMIAARMPSGFKNEFLKAYQGSVKRLGLSESAIPAGAQFGKQGLETAQELSGQFPRSGIADNMRKAQESIRTLFEGVKKGVPATANDFSAIAVNQDGQRRALANSIARSNDKNTLLIENRINQILKPPAKANVDDLGKVLKTNIEAAEAQAKKSTDEQYDVLADVANNAGFQMQAKDFIDMLPRIKAGINPGGAFDEAAVSRVEKDLMRQRDAPVLIYDAGEKLKSVKKSLATLTKERLSGKKISKARLNQIKANELRYQGEAQNLNKEIKELQSISGPLNFKGFDAYIRRFNDARPDNAVGGTTTDAFSAGISAELSRIRKDTYSKYNATMPDGSVKNLGDEFQKATELVQARGAYEKNTLGYILKEAGGEQSVTQRQIVSNVMSDPFKIDRVLQASRELELADPTQAGITQKMQEMMQIQYLNDLGMGSKKGVALLNYDQGMLNSLYGNKSAAIARGLDSINGKLRVLKSADVPQMTLTDLNSLSSALSQDARNEVANGIIKRNALEKQEEALVTSSIFKAAKKGNFKDIDPDLLSKSILSKGNTIKDTETVMVNLGKLSPESRNLFKGDFMRNLLDDYSGGVPSASAPYTPLFDAKKFLADWQSPTGKSQFAQKLEIVLGQKDAQFMYDLAKVYEGNTITDIAAKGSNLRTIKNQGGTTYVLPITPILTAAKNRYLAAMLSTGTERYGLKSALARNALPGEVNDAYVKMFKGTFMTRQGITALANQASSDPEFSAELQNALKDFNEKEGLQFKQD